MSRRPTLSYPQPDPASASGAVSPRTGHPGRSAPQRGDTPARPDTHSVAPANGDHLVPSVRVGASFFTAAELAELKLPGLPERREHISRLATRKGWPYRDRAGKGGGREFALADLPPEARGEIQRRRIIEAASNSLQPHAPLPTLANLKHKQAERLAARAALLLAFDRFKGGRSTRAMLVPFVEAFEGGLVPLDDWARPNIAKLSVRTMERWLAARAKGDDETLAGRWAGGRRATLDRSPEGAEFILGAHVAQPRLSADMLHQLLQANFPGGVPAEGNVLIDHPSPAAIGRFLTHWKSDARNAATLMAIADPDRFKSKFRFAPGNAAGGIIRANQRWQIDASPADVLCTDGRNSIYVLVDVYSRRLMALVSRTPKTVASLLLVARAIEAWGVPEELWTDNGSDFKSKHFVLVLRQLGIHHHLAPPFSPERKPFIERAIGTVQHGFMPLMPGYVGHDVATRSQIRARQAFAARLGESDENAFGVAVNSGDLQDQLVAWLANIYEHKPHSSLDRRTPAEVFASSVQEHGQKFARPEGIGMLLMPPASGHTRIVGKKGITVDGLDYYCDDMIPGQELQVKLDPADLGRVYLYTTGDPWQFVGIAENPELQGLDRAEVAARVRAQQNAHMVAGKAILRASARKADIHEVARRMIGIAPAPDTSFRDFTHSTPALDAAHQAATTAPGPRRSAPGPASDQDRADHAVFVTDFEEARLRRQIEETPEERYARWKKLGAAIAAGEEISAESRAWHVRHATSGECLGQQLVEESLGE
jgi:putative transposase